MRQGRYDEIAPCKDCRSGRSSDRMTTGTALRRAMIDELSLPPDRPAPPAREARVPEVVVPLALGRGWRGARDPARGVWRAAGGVSHGVGQVAPAPDAATWRRPGARRVVGETAAVPLHNWEYGVCGGCERIRRQTRSRPGAAGGAGVRRALWPCVWWRAASRGSSFRRLADRRGLYSAR